jgi:hypothetical protein
MFYTFTQATKREFDAAFKAGRPVSLVKDPSWAADHETFVSRGFTSGTVADPYADGPSRPGESWFFWVADIATATPVGPVEYGHADEPWRFFCEACGWWIGGEVRSAVEHERGVHAASHAASKRTTNWTGLEVTGPAGGRGVVVDGIPKKSGPNKGKVEVMWIGGRYTVAEPVENLQRAENLQRVEAVAASAGDASRFSSQAGLASIRGGAR